MVTGAKAGIALCSILIVKSGFSAVIWILVAKGICITAVLVGKGLL